MIRLLIAIVCSGLLIFFFIEKTNHLNELRLKVPQLEKSVKKIQRENERISFDLAQFSDPKNLLELMEKKEYSHLRFPTQSEVIVVE